MCVLFLPSSCVPCPKGIEQCGTLGMRLHHQSLQASWASILYACRKEGCGLWWRPCCCIGAAGRIPELDADAPVLATN